MPERVEAALGLRKDPARVIRQVRPDRVVCSSPERNYARIGVSHPGHRAVGSAALDAIYPDARNPFAFPERYLFTERPSLEVTASNRLPNHELRSCYPFITSP